MNIELIKVCAEIALRVGPALYNQLADLLGSSIPTWDDLAKDNDQLASWIAEEERK